ncbi:hypothetical protein LGL55_10515 [Clostridium tagluense]|uniref:hypothetical protein n=1 Tax=Clostridium tagluense TaxID=360422 RepID=UPI001CF5F9AF|nr:hypothetical protein [Clostridium tagluense]MCB2311628.1 hypothetical protein [Clostridium tagluense]MCB2316352.1 hypothetical protein [Clostridium tagluense]MCB2321264.1 hypothetical protein [Clostridium tagluense]MCB2326221.1 hypothetical protein [Clostridium tagluense]MCB2331000.1 hypothetical protein [Clostridium tagluense]
MEKSIESLIGIFGVVGFILMLFSTSVVIVTSLIICWTLLIIYMVSKIKTNKGDKK